MINTTRLATAGVAGAVVLAGSVLAAVAVKGQDAAGPTVIDSRAATATTTSTDRESSPASGDGSSAPSAAGYLSREEAVDIARSALGTATSVGVHEAYLESEHGGMIWDVEFADHTEVKIDATTGDVVKIEHSGSPAGDSWSDDGDDWGDDDSDHADDHGDHGDDHGHDDDRSGHEDDD